MRCRIEDAPPAGVAFNLGLQVPGLLSKASDNPWQTVTKVSVFFAAVARSSSQ